MVFQALSLRNGLPDAPFVDGHGNHVHRVRLCPGTNCIRHDPTVAVSSDPDNAGLDPVARPLAPHDLLRYVMPSRYGDSDKLADFAWEKFGHVEPVRFTCRRRPSHFPFSRTTESWPSCSILSKSSAGRTNS